MRHHHLSYDKIMGGKAQHWLLLQNKYTMVECDITIYYKTKARGKAHH